jgi:hypothetical protein
MAIVRRFVAFYHSGKVIAGSVTLLCRCLKPCKTEEHNECSDDVIYFHGSKSRQKSGGYSNQHIELNKKDLTFFSIATFYI